MTRGTFMALAAALACPAPALAGTIAVNSAADLPQDPSAGSVCRTSVGTCTLRAALEAANQASGPTLVMIPAGRFELTRSGKPSLSQASVLGNDPDDGFLKITGSITVKGAGAGRTTIDGDGLDRVFGIRAGATATISDLTITGGDATVPAVTSADIALGGGILNFGELDLDRVALLYNHADGGGGVFTAPGGIFTIRDSLIAYNTAVEGGGVRADTGGEIDNTTITHNTLQYRPPAELLPDEIWGYGGGIDHRGGANLTIVNSTITDNHAIKTGGGLNSGQDYAPIGPLADAWPFRVYLRNTIIAGNTAEATPGNCHVSAMVIQSLGHNLASDGSCFLTAAGDLPNRDPALAPLTDNGGPTRSQAPLAGSPAIDAGTNSGCPSADQRGVHRPQGAACDIGAVEYVASATSPRCARTVTIRLPAHSKIVVVMVDGNRAHYRRTGGNRIVVDVPATGGAHRVALVTRGRASTRRVVRRVPACS